MPSVPENESFRRRSFLGSFSAIGFLGLSGQGCTGSKTVGRPLAPNASEEPEFDGEFLLPQDLVYLNCASLGPCPRSVMDAVTEAWNQLESNPVHHAFGPMLQQMEQVRGKAAGFLGCEKDELSFTENATEAMNAIAQGIRFDRGDRILTSDQEHPGGSVCWEYFSRRSGVGIDKFSLGMPPKDEGGILDSIEKSLTPKTRVISVSHVTYPTGVRLPIRRIGELARSRGVMLVVDGAQAVGMSPVNLSELSCDAYAASAHKWLLAPKGTGFLYVNRGAMDRIQPISLFSGPSAYSASSGTRSVPSVIGLGASLDFFLKSGLDKVARHSMGLRAQLLDGLKRVSGIKVASPLAGALASSMLSFSVNDKKTRTIAEALSEKSNIVVKVASSPGFDGLRISPHVYNDSRDMDKLLGSLRELLA